MGITVVRTPNQILHEIYINTEMKILYTRDGNDYPYEDIVNTGANKPEKVSKKNKAYTDTIDFAPGNNYGFYDRWGNLKFTIYNPDGYEHVESGHIFEYAGINLYKGLSQIIEMDIDEDEKYKRCKELIEKLAELGEIFENAAYIKYKVDKEKLEQQLDANLQDVVDEQNSIKQSINALNNRSFGQKLFNTAGNVER